MLAALARRYARALLALAMAAIGVMHFVRPLPFERIVPGWLPAPHALVLVSGAAEIALAAALLFPRLRRLASFGLVALFVAVFPANIHMAVHRIQLEPDSTLPTWAMWARLPLQLVFVAWALWVGREDARRSHPRHSHPG